MKPEKLILVLFVCMAILLAMMYGAFEIGGLEMGKCEKIVFGLLVCFFVLIVAFVMFVYIYECFLCSSNDCRSSGNDCRIYISDIKAIELEGDLRSFYVFKGEKGAKVPKKTQAVIYCGSDVLKQSHFADKDSLKCLVFAGSSRKIEKDLYTTLIANNVNITICNGNVLTLVNKDDEAASSVKRKAEPKKQQECAVNGKNDLSPQKN